MTTDTGESTPAPTRTLWARVVETTENGQEVQLWFEVLAQVWDTRVMGCAPRDLADTRLAMALVEHSNGRPAEDFFLEREIVRALEGSDVSQLGEALLVLRNLADKLIAIGQESAAAYRILDRGCERGEDKNTVTTP